jgi:hypothetical protein
MRAPRRARRFASGQSCTLTTSRSGRHRHDTFVCQARIGHPLVPGCAGNQIAARDLTRQETVR